MRTPTTALLWEIWQRRRLTAAAIAALTVIGRAVDVMAAASNPPSNLPPLTTSCAMLAFLLLFAVFNYTEGGGARTVGRFPERLFALPVSSVRLVAVPVVAGIASIELLYLLWMEPFSRGASTSRLFVAVLLAACMVFHQAVLWMLDRMASLRLIVIGAAIVATFGIGLLPSFPPNPPPVWRSEGLLSAVVASFAVGVFLLSWRHVARLRAGGGRSTWRLSSLVEWIVETLPARRTPLGSAAAAQVWFEWRRSGLVLPVLVGAVVLVVIAPMSWMARGDPGGTFRMLLAALAAPIVLSVPVGVAFSKPVFWSEDLRVPAFVAVQPLSAEDLVVTKIKVAALSTAFSWLAVIAFVTVWLPSWANLDSLSLFAIQLWAFHGRSVAAVWGIAGLVVIAGMFLTWRFLVIRLWNGLSGSRTMFVASVMSIVITAIAALVFDATRLPGWLLRDPARLTAIAWFSAVVVVAKYWVAAYAWRGVSPRHLYAYLVVWLAGTASFMALGLVVWGVVRIYLPLDVDRARSIVILLALIVMPLARVGLAPSSLTRNRHRSR